MYIIIHNNSNAFIIIKPIAFSIERKMFLNAINFEYISIYFIMSNLFHTSYL